MLMCVFDIYFSCVCFFFFKQKTAYDMRISDWSSDVCSSDLLKAKFEATAGARLVEGYGLSESSGVVSCNPYEGDGKSGTIGQPIPGTRVRLVDKDDPLRPAPEGEPGEIVAAGPQIMRGYWNRPDADAKVFVTDAEGTRWLRTDRKSTRLNSSH